MHAPIGPPFFPSLENFRALDSVIAHGSALLAGAINRALQPRLSVAQLCWLTG